MRYPYWSPVPDSAQDAPELSHLEIPSIFGISSPLIKTIQQGIPPLLLPVSSAPLPLGLVYWYARTTLYFPHEGTTASSR